jgi:ATP-binding cassette subfamily B protein
MRLSRRLQPDAYLDTVTEELVNQNLANLHCTQIVIAHRLSTIRESDTIVLLDRGKIAAQGRHDELLVNAPTYAQLIGVQQGQINASLLDKHVS